MTKDADLPIIERYQDHIIRFCPATKRFRTRILDKMVAASDIDVLRDRIDTAAAGATLLSVGQHAVHLPEPVNGDEPNLDDVRSIWLFAETRDTYLTRDKTGVAREVLKRSVIPWDDRKACSVTLRRAKTLYRSRRANLRAALLRGLWDAFDQSMGEVRRRGRAPTTFRWSCSVCNTSLAVALESTGRPRRCPEYDQIVEIPAEEQLEPV